MTDAMDLARRQANAARYTPGHPAGHYESFFVRANHPARPLAFWIRYTIFSPQQHPERAVGELWAIYFDGETRQHVAAKTELPFAQCAFSNTALDVRIGEASLRPGLLAGAAGSAAPAIAWNLSYRGDAPALFLLPHKLYTASLPRAKSLVALPLAVFDGTLRVGEQTVDVQGWVGSQNHNWGSRHTDHYAWGQVAGFDTHPESFLEVATARLKIGPLWTPFMTTLVLRHDGNEIAINTLRQAIRARASFEYFSWRFVSETDRVRIEGAIDAPRDAFVGLRYANPPGGIKQCLNSKLAACELKLIDKRQTGQPSATQVLSTRHRAAFEILTDDQTHGVAIRA
jgi:hypothetical protein